MDQPITNNSLQIKRFAPFCHLVECTCYANFLHGLHIYIQCHLYELKVNISEQYQTLKCTLTCENYVSTLHHQVQ
jgi:hypothetical protein